MDVIFGCFGDVDVFEDLEYLGIGYEKRGDDEVFGGMGCVGGE